MPLHESTFEYLKPSVDQIETMAKFRGEARQFAKAIEDLIPEGPDKTYMLRKVREVAMWGNVAITRGPDGSPRS